MAAVAKPRYQGLVAARRWQHDPVKPRADFSLAVGDRVGELTVIGHLARGRATELYQVWSNRHWCALTAKIVAPEACEAGKVPASLRKEERVLARVRHPNIVQVFGHGDADGRHFLLMEYLAGPSLFDVLESLPRRRLHVPDAVRAVMHVGAAVHYLHRCGWLYRDLKPANVHLREGIPVLLDFDVVWPIEPARRPGDRLGTAPYMAPEQALREPLTPATDVYGLGALLYELLTGKWPTDEPSEDDEEDFDWDDEDEFEEAELAQPRITDNSRALTMRELEQRYPQLKHPPVPPRQHNPQVTPELEDLVLRALATAPRDRFQTVSGMLAALAPMLKGRHRLWPEGVPVERRSDTKTR
ncbi:MAG TPA: serine/threonine-protein kinase [Longimicrobium sp.]|nr:serine/threonine-protein kinase [Longimicrobium sp.]